MFLAKRPSEKYLTTIKEYLGQLHRELLPYITKTFIFIEHSFAFARFMIETRSYQGDYIKLFIEMGRGAPHITDVDKSFTDMTDAELVENLKQTLDPSTKEIYDYQPFIDMIMPMLKADAKTGDVLIPSNPINTPIIVYGGEKDCLSEEFLNRG
ncbi:unnamed protein product [Adineta steineri]|uniref:Uncharacterized protein n=2 Tax=Adineta steineri TaxID=433720 RepID=A0A819KMD8_9BILA|nr:unnamed protein product [Adineta steineri]